jgi:hypothetical protein
MILSPVVGFMLLKNTAVGIMSTLQFSKCVQNYSQLNQKERNYLIDIASDGKMILKQIIYK